MALDRKYGKGDFALVPTTIQEEKVVFLKDYFEAVTHRKSL